jgi:hypothetical protein
VPGATIALIGAGLGLGGNDLVHLTGSGKLAFAAGIEKDGDFANGAWTYYGEGLELAIEPDFLDEEDDRCIDVVEGPVPLADGKLVALCGVRNGVSLQSESLFYGEPGHLELQVLNGSAAPGDADPPFTFFTIGDLKVRDGGIVAFSATLDSPELDLGKAGVGAYVWSPEGFERVLQTGMPAPGITAQYVSSLSLEGLTADGRVLLSGKRTGGDPEAAKSLWVGTNSSDIELVAAGGDPTTLPDETLRVADHLNYLTDSGELITLASRSAGTSLAVWLRREGQPFAPIVAGNGSRLNPLSGLLAVSPHGRVALVADYWPTPDESATGLWVGAADNLKLIAVEGSPLRGMEDKQLIRFESLHLNDQGHLVLHAFLSDDQFTEQLLRYSPAEGFEPVVEPDELVDDNGETRAIIGWEDCAELSDYPEQNEHCLDDDGRFAFLVSYSDGEAGLIITDPLPSGGEDVDLQVPGDGQDDAGDNGAGGAGGTPGNSDPGTSHGGKGSGNGDGDVSTSGGQDDSAGGDDGSSTHPGSSNPGGGDSGGCSVHRGPVQRGTQNLFWLVALAIVVRRVRRLASVQ